MRYNMINTSEGKSTISLILDDGEVRLINDSHPNYLRIAQALLAGDDPSEWLDGSPSVAFIERLSDRVTIEDDVLHFDGDPVYNGLADTVMRYHREGRDATNLVRFMERLSANPSRRSREQLFTWTQAKELVIDRDGYIIAYKGVASDMMSLSSGEAEVDGVKHTGRIPNLVGTVISMPRSEVQDDPNKGCSYGLHVGNWSYANSFGSVTLEVRVDPADVVSVPADSAYQKMRTCRYEVVAVHESDEGSLDAYEPEALWDDEDAMDAFADYAPPTFMQRLRDRLRRNRNLG